ncbi:MAG TPA: nitronate monooxygenase [Smithella sp.]|jgi:nitronate monooxygenase|nr:nitronate monooxygenase [Smithella sp.]
MFQTKITEMLGIKYPIIGGTMMWISSADFVAAISNAGGLGIIASCMYKTREEFSKALDRILELTDKPFGVNINFFPTMQPIDNNEYLDVLLEKGVKIVETSGHSAPEDMCQRFKKSGLVWIHKCVGVRYAQKAESLGADIITVVGQENGGATGKLDIGTMVLVPRVVESVKVPVIGGGGVATGESFLAVLALGAQAVIIGTRLLMTKEAPIHDNLKNALLKASELDTMLIMRSLGATHRVWISPAAKRCLELENNHDDIMEVLQIVSGERAKMMYGQGDLSAGIISCGQDVGLSHDIPTVKELFDRIIAQASVVAKRLAT